MQTACAHVWSGVRAYHGIETLRTRGVPTPDWIDFCIICGAPREGFHEEAA